jgi:hypothetical protein
MSRQSVAGEEVVDRMNLPPWACAAFKRRERFLFPVIGIKYFLLLSTHGRIDSEALG